MFPAIGLILHYITRQGQFGYQLLFHQESGSVSLFDAKVVKRRCMKRFYFEVQFWISSSVRPLLMLVAMRRKLSIPNVVMIGESCSALGVANELSVWYLAELDSTWLNGKVVI